MRALLAHLLVLHYLLTGVLGGAWATITREDAPSAAHPYVHSVLCQTHNYLRLDCFDHCNGEQAEHLLKQLATGGNEEHHRPGGASQNRDKAPCDVHILTEPVPVPARLLYVQVLRAERTLPVPLLATGISPVEGPPPKVAPAFAG